MIGKVKQWLGIEGVKLELEIPEGQYLSKKEIKGRIKIQSMHTQTLTEIRLVLIERFSRGRGEERLIDEYELGRKRILKTIEVQPEEEIIVSFKLPFEPLESDIDRWGNRNVVNQQLAKAARWFRKASSQFRVEAEAEVKGVALNPFDKKTIELK